MDTEVKNQIKDQRSWRNKYTVGLAYLLTYHPVVASNAATKSSHFPGSDFTTTNFL